MSATGERNGNHKLTVKEVLRLRELRSKYGTSFSKLGQMFRVHRDTARKAYHTNWKELDYGHS